ncbi:MAG: hypothetical protein LC117_06075 [Bacteroidia bacterium]|nr:hypothetical protein [Bacteroidia bacterium]MCZ2277477.1 hypothetical protein [Bacteroidia bacterium]
MQPKTVYMIVITLILMVGLIIINKFIKSEVIDRYPYIFAIVFVVIAHYLSVYLLKRKNKQ